MPDFAIEISINTKVCGLDEVGRGPLAGPVVGGCVYIPAEKRGLDFIAAIRDSKTLSVKKLHALDKEIRTHFIWGVGEASPEEIDGINILQASFLAMRRAYEACNFQKDMTALIDGHLTPKSFPCPAHCVVKGDSKSVSIAAASIVAKVTRDRIMENLAREHPHYGWERNVGYPSPEHLEAINRHGITPHHRRSYAPVRNFIEFGVVRPSPVILSGAVRSRV